MGLDAKRLHQLLQLATLEDLVSFSEAYAAKDIDFGDSLMSFLGRKYVDNKMPGEYADQMAAAFAEARDIGDRWHSYEVKDWDAIFHEASKILDEGDKLLALGNADVAAEIAMEFFQQLCDHFDMNELYDDEFLGGSSECAQAETLLILALGHPNISDTTKKQISADVKELSNDDLDNYDLVDLDDLKLQVTIATASKEDGLKLLDKQIEDSRGSYDEHVYVKRKIDMLRQMGREEDAEKTEQKFIYLPEIRRNVVNRLVDQKNYAEAERLVRSAIDMDKAEGRNYQAESWTERLLEIYELTGNKTRQTEVAKELFVAKGGRLVYYHKLKALIPVSQWKEELGELIKKTQFSDNYFSGQANLPDIFVEEGDKESLYQYVVKHSDETTGALDFYSKHIVDEHAGELLALYEKLLKREASGPANVKMYPRIASSMECMAKLKGGSEAAHRLAVYFRQLYRRRSSMMAAISKF